MLEEDVDFSSFLALIPARIYWVDKEGKVLYCTSFKRLIMELHRRLSLARTFEIFKNQRSHSRF